MSNSSCVCLPRLVVRTSGFHPDNMGSIPVGDAKDLDTFKVFFCFKVNQIETFLDKKTFPDCLPGNKSFMLSRSYIV